MNRQQFIPGAKSSMPNKDAHPASLRIDPNHSQKPAHPFSSTGSSRAPPSNATKSLAKTKTSHNSPDSASIATIGGTPLGQLPEMNSKKRSIERAPLPNTIPKKKLKAGSGRHSLKALENNGNQSDDQGYGSDIKLSQHSQTLKGIDNTPLSSKDVASIDASRWHFRQDVTAMDSESTPIVVRHHQEHPTETPDSQSIENHTNHRNRTNQVRFDESCLKNPVSEVSDSESQQSPAPNSSSEDGDFLNDINDDMEDNDPVEVTPVGFKKYGLMGKKTACGNVGIGELASEKGIAAPMFPTRQLSVIDVGLNESTANKKYDAPALYIAEKATWTISTESIPNDSQRLAEWEVIGRDMAMRAAQLISDFIDHLRDRGKLFQQAEKRVVDHKESLKIREKTFASQLSKVSLQCETLIQDIKEGTY